MDDFRSQGRKLHVASMFVTGGVFGLFLTMSQAWSNFLRDAILSLLPDNEDVVFSQFVYALSATFICTFLAVILVRIDICFEDARDRKIVSKNIKRLFLQPRSRVEEVQTTDSRTRVDVMRGK